MDRSAGSKQGEKGPPWYTEVFCSTPHFALTRVQLLRPWKPRQPYPMRRTVVVLVAIKDVARGRNATAAESSEDLRRNRGSAHGEHDTQGRQDAYGLPVTCSARCAPALRGSAALAASR
jgi:hypothetical protein